MKGTMLKLASLAMILSFLFAFPCASADMLNTDSVTVPSSQWEAGFLALLEQMELGDNPAFTVTEVPEYDPAFRFVHALDIRDFLSISYYDDGNDAFNSSVLTINLDGVGDSTEQVWSAIIAATIAGDPNATEDLVVELMDVVCPIFAEVLTGEQRLNGAQTATLNGIGYMMELDDSARTARYFTNVVLESDN